MTGTWPGSTASSAGTPVRAGDPSPGGRGVTLRLILDDDKGNIMTLDMLTVSEEQAGQLAENFRAQPEKLYESILQTLLENQEE